MLYLGEVIEAEKSLSIKLFHDGNTVEYDVTESKIANFLKVNDLHTGKLLQSCGPHIKNPRFFFPRHRR